MTQIIVDLIHAIVFQTVQLKIKEKPILALKLVKFYEISLAFVANELYMNCTFKNLESKKKNW